MINTKLKEKLMTGAMIAVAIVVTNLVTDFSTRKY